MGKEWWDPRIMLIMVILSTWSSHSKSLILHLMASREPYFNINGKNNFNGLIPHNVITFWPKKVHLICYCQAPDKDFPVFILEPHRLCFNWMLILIFDTTDDIEPLILTLHGVSTHFIKMENYLIDHKSETNQPKKNANKVTYFYTFLQILGQNSKDPLLQKSITFWHLGSQHSTAK